MKTSFRIPAATALVLILAAFGTTDRAPAALLVETGSYTPDLLIPDGSALGVADTHTFSSSIATISEVRVSLQIAGASSPGDAFNGDFYVYLTHGSGFAVLLNRPGRTAVNSFGYADSGFDVTFDDSPAGADIHNYQLVSNPGGGQLTGAWSSDGRAIDPTSVLDTTPRSSSLASFNGLDPNGTWTLFVADLSPIGTGRLVTWQLEITGHSIPEPGSALAGVLSLGAGVCCRWSRRRRQ
jgi:hypothetical protein